MGWGDTLGDSLRFVIENRKEKKRYADQMEMYDASQRESRRRWDIEQAASADQRALLKAAQDRLGREQDRAAGESFMSNLNAYEGALPGVSQDEMAELRGAFASDPSAALRHPRTEMLRQSAMQGFAPGWAKLREDERKAALEKARAGHGSVFDVEGRIRLAQAQAALKALTESSKLDVPPSGMYPIEIGPDGKMVTHGADDLAKRRQTAALAALSAIFGLDLGVGAAPDAPAGARQPARKPLTSFQPPVTPSVPRAPGGGIPGANFSPASPLPPVSPQGVLMRHKGSGETGYVPPAEVARALASGEWEHVTVPIGR